MISVLLNISWNEWWLGLLNTFIGAVIGSGATIFALYKTFKNDKRKEDQHKLDFQKEKLKYLQSLMRSIRTGLEVQIQHLLPFAATIKADPLNIPLLTFVPLNELTRLVHKINQEDYYHSYLGEFGDHQSVIDEFRDIISTMNYFDAYINQIKSVLEKSVQYDHERKLKLKELFDKIKQAIIALLIDNDIQQSEKEYWQQSKHLMETFDNADKAAEGKTDLRFYYENMIEPLQTILSQFESKFDRLAPLVIDTVNAINLYHNILLQNDSVANDFEEDKKALQKEYDELHPKIKRLMDWGSK